MRSVIDSQGREWKCAELVRYGIGDRPADITTVVVRVTSGQRSMNIDMHPGQLMELTDPELSQAVDVANAWEDARTNNTRMRAWIDREGVEWLVNEEGLPGKSRGVKGGICLRFISLKGTRYLCPAPPWWADESDSSLEHYLRQATPVARQR